jgi:hypothetical protein
MKFARVVFLIAGLWGILLLTPMFFLFDYIGRQHSLPITYPQFFYGFLAITMAWQFGFLVIASDPDRYRLMMIPSVIEKFGFVVTMAVLYVQLRAAAADMLVVAPDFVLGTLFTIAFVKTGRSI